MLKIINEIMFSIRHLSGKNIQFFITESDDEHNIQDIFSDVNLEDEIEFNIKYKDKELNYKTNVKSIKRDYREVKTSDRGDVKLLALDFELIEQ